MKTPTPFPDPIYITRPSLPDLKILVKSLERIWERGIVTNMGPEHGNFEESLKRFLRVPNISLFCNGTLALQLGCQTMRLSGEIITTQITSLLQYMCSTGIEFNLFSVILILIPIILILT